MSAGTGIQHAEYNLEPEVTKIFQIWILRNERGGAPFWGAKPFPKDERAGHFITLASGFDSDSDALRIRADARVIGATLKAGQTAEYRLRADRKAYLVPATGVVELNGVRVGARDGAAVRDEDMLRVRAVEHSEIVLVDAA